MLKMECPHCKHKIYSHLLAEVNSVVCKNCKTDVPVKDLYISAKGYTMLRSDLLMRMHRYEKLLKEAEKELTLMVGGKKTCDETVQSIDSFIATLREMLEDARKHFRLSPHQLPVNLKTSTQTISGKIVNMSTTGVCIEPEDKNLLPKLHEKIELNFSLPGIEELFEIRGKVCWIKKGAKKREFDTGIGIKFEKLDEKTKTGLWLYIEKLDAAFTRADHH
jgi:Tfp pilus assembly protein PilZ